MTIYQILIQSTELKNLLTLLTDWNLRGSHVISAVVNEQIPWAHKLRGQRCAFVAKFFSLMGLCQTRWPARLCVGGGLVSRGHAPSLVYMTFYVLLNASLIAPTKHSHVIWKQSRLPTDRRKELFTSFRGKQAIIKVWRWNASDWNFRTVKPPGALRKIVNETPSYQYSETLARGHYLN